MQADQNPQLYSGVPAQGQVPQQQQAQQPQHYGAPIMNHGIQQHQQQPPQYTHLQPQVTMEQYKLQQAYAQPPQQYYQAPPPMRTEDSTASNFEDPRTTQVSYHQQQAHQTHLQQIPQQNLQGMPQAGVLPQQQTQQQAPPQGHYMQQQPMHALQPHQVYSHAPQDPNQQQAIYQQQPGPYINQQAPMGYMSMQSQQQPIQQYQGQQMAQQISQLPQQHYQPQPMMPPQQQYPQQPMHPQQVPPQQQHPQYVNVQHMQQQALADQKVHQQQQLHPHQGQVLQSQQQPIYQQQAQHLHMLHPSAPIQAKVENPHVLHAHASNPLPAQQQHSDPQVQQLAQHHSEPAQLPSKVPASPLKQAPPQQTHTLQEVHEERKVLQSSDVSEDKAPTQGVVEGTVGEGPKRGHLAFVNADTYQAAILNKLLPPKYRIEILEVAQRNYEQKIQQQKKLKALQESQRKKEMEAAAKKQKQQAPPIPAPIAAMNAKKLPTTLSGQVIGPEAAHSEDVIMTEGKGKSQVPNVGQKAPVNIGQQQMPKSPLANVSSSSLAQIGGLSAPALAQRTSARDKKQIDYNQMANTGQTGTVPEYPGEAVPAARTLQKKVSNNQGSSTLVSPSPHGQQVQTQYEKLQAQYEEQKSLYLEQRKEVEQSKISCQRVLSFLKAHGAASELLQPPNFDNPVLQQMQNEPGFEFVNLNTIENNFTQGKYQSTLGFGRDVTKMWQNYRRLLAHDPAKIDQINSFKSYFDTSMTQLNIVNKQLVTPAEPQMPVFVPEPAQPAQIQKAPQIQPQPPVKKSDAIKKAEKAQAEVNKFREKNAAAQVAAQQAQAQQLPPKQATAQAAQANAQAAQLASQSNNAKMQRQIQQIDNTISQAIQSTQSDKPMTLDEKNILKNNIGHLTPDQQRGIIEIVADVINQNGGEVFEFELDQLPSRKCRELETYVKKCISINQKKEKRKIADQARRAQQKQSQQMNKQGSSGPGSMQGSLQAQSAPPAPPSQQAQPQWQEMMPQQIPQQQQQQQPYYMVGQAPGQMTQQMQGQAQQQQQFVSSQVNAPHLYNPMMQGQVQPQVIQHQMPQQQLGMQGMMHPQQQQLVQNSSSQGMMQLPQQQQQTQMGIQQTMPQQLQPVNNPNFMMAGQPGQTRRPGGGTVPEDSSDSDSSSDSDESDSEDKPQTKGRGAAGQSKGSLWPKN